MDDDTKRREMRKEYVSQFLSEIGVAYDTLAPSTHQCLDDWARQVLLVTDQPSANWGTVILHLCRAVESQLASSLGQVQGLEFLAASEPLGSKSQSLKRSKLDNAVKQRLTARGIKPGFVSSKLPALLRDLAELRSQTDAAHGGLEIRTATIKDAQQARAMAGNVLQGIVLQHSKGQP